MSRRRDVRRPGSPGDRARRRGGSRFAAVDECDQPVDHRLGRDGAIDDRDQHGFQVGVAQSSARCAAGRCQKPGRKGAARGVGRGRDGTLSGMLMPGSSWRRTVCLHLRCGDLTKPSHYLRGPEGTTGTSGRRCRRLGVKSPPRRVVQVRGAHQTAVEVAARQCAPAFGAQLVAVDGVEPAESRAGGRRRNQDLQHGRSQRSDSRNARRRSPAHSEDPRARQCRPCPSSARAGAHREVRGDAVIREWCMPRGIRTRRCGRRAPMTWWQRP